MQYPEKVSAHYIKITIKLSIQIACLQDIFQSLFDLTVDGLATDNGIHKNG